jgi:hypothetical protein
MKLVAEVLDTRREQQGKGIKTYRNRGYFTTDSLYRRKAEQKTLQENKVQKSWDGPYYFFTLTV